MDENVSYGKLERYKIPSFNNIKYKKTDAKINRLFVLHNFKKGVMYVNYSYIMYAANGDVIAGSSNAYSKWHLEKKDDRWIVVDIDEKP